MKLIRFIAHGIIFDDSEPAPLTQATYPFMTSAASMKDLRGIALNRNDPAAMTFLVLLMANHLTHL